MGGSHYLNYAGSGSNFDFFHIGALLVVIMAIVTGIVLCVAVVGVCCFHWLDDYQDRKKVSPHVSPHHQRSHHSDSRRNNSISVLDEPPSNRDVLRNSFIRNHIIHFEECPYPTGKVISLDAAKIDEEPPPPYDFLFPTSTSLATNMPPPPMPLTTDVDVTVTNEDRNSRDVSTRF